MRRGFAGRVLVTGATGRIGGEVVRQLVDAGVPARALTRRPEIASLPAVVDVVAGDLTVPESLDRALQGVDAVFLLWTAPAATVEEAVTRIAGRARRIVLLTSPHQTPHPFFRQPNPMADLHARIERAIGSTGVEHTFIRPGMFASNVVAWWAPQIKSGDVVRWPHGAVETAPIDEGDIAGVAACALCDDTLAGGDFVLTGPESLSHAEQVSTIGAAIGRRLRFHELSPDEFRNQMAGRWPAPVVDMLLNAWGAAVGLPAYVTHMVATITGRPARTFGEWAVAHASAFSLSGSDEGVR
jgi:uncharacterized protein YbjT (DUF2867 family)